MELLTKTQQELWTEAEAFLTICYKELGKTEADLKNRLAKVKESIENTGFYEHTLDELEHGTRMAWRNSNRCIGRLFWQSLHVFDARKAETVDEIKSSVYNHIQFATNGGKIRPVITIFKPYQSEKNQMRIWNHQLIRYAGYETETGEVIGDPHSIHFTKRSIELGWRGNGTAFDLLPIVIQINGQKPEWFELPQEMVLEVPISHPEYQWFSDLGLKWYAVPIISEMKLEIGGIEYKAAPFNGWYMGTEIGARNFADENRYNMLPTIAEKLELDMSRNMNLWKDRALVELNIAVLHSYREAGVSIVDHHTASQQFKLFEQSEADAGRHLTGDWDWLIPPVSPATTHIFHHSYENTINKPNYFYQPSLY